MWDFGHKYHKIELGGDAPEDAESIMAPPPEEQKS